MASDSKRQWTPLHGATWLGDVDKVRELLEGGKCHVDCVHKDGLTPLCVAIVEGHLDVVRVLISEFKADVNACTDYGETPLHKAASGGHLDEEGYLGMVRVLISEFRADVNACTDLGETPLHQAATWGYLGVVRVLISEFRADVNACTDQGETPLHLATYRGRLGIIRVLISEFRADVNACTECGETPLHLAAYMGHLSVVRVLISEFKADVNAHTSSGSTPFDVAVNHTYNREEVAVVLINEFHYDTKGGTPYIHRACEEGWVNLVRALVEKHGTGIVTARDDEGNTPLHVAAMSGREYAVHVLINEFNCDKNVKGYKGRSILHSACAAGEATVQILICDYKADVTARDDEGNTPLHVAAMNGREDVVKFLVNKPGCDVKVIGQLGWSLLHSACVSNEASLVRFVSQHISPWVVDDNGDTPLHICARLGNVHSVKALLELDPPVMSRNKLGQTPRDLEKMKKPTIRYIDEYMKDHKGNIYSQYEAVQSHARMRYSHPEPITRAFVIGYPGAGKSSLVEALKREGWVDSFRCHFGLIHFGSRVSVPPHTAGTYSPQHPHQRALWQGLVLRLCRRC